MNTSSELDFSLLQGKGVEPGQNKHCTALDLLTLLMLHSSVTCFYTLISVRSRIQINTHSLIGSPYHPGSQEIHYRLPRWFLWTMTNQLLRYRHKGNHCPSYFLINYVPRGLILLLFNKAFTWSILSIVVPCVLIHAIWNTKPNDLCHRVISRNRRISGEISMCKEFWVAFYKTETNSDCSNYFHSLKGSCEK